LFILGGHYLYFILHHDKIELGTLLPTELCGVIESIGLVVGVNFGVGKINPSDEPNNAVQRDRLPVFMMILTIDVINIETSTAN